MCILHALALNFIPSRSSGNHDEDRWRPWRHLCSGYEFYLRMLAKSSPPLKEKKTLQYRTYFSLQRTKSCFKTWWCWADKSPVYFLGFRGWSTIDFLVAVLRDLSPGKWKNDAESWRMALRASHTNKSFGYQNLLSHKMKTEDDFKGIRISITIGRAMAVVEIGII